MTGFGAASSDAAGVAIRVEARSVNHRHLQVKARLPAELSWLEPELEALARKRLHRGSLSVTVSVALPPGACAAVLDADLAARYHRELAALSQELGLGGEVTLGELLALPGVVAPPGDDDVHRRLARRVLRVTGEALGHLQDMRAAEGAALAAELARHCAGLEQIVARVEKRMPKVVRSHQRALRRRVAELVADTSGVSQADLARELALIADKGDVSEEISRLRSHLRQLETALGRGGAVGRRLDFLVQELFREVNTIGSKCADASVAHWVVDAKTRIERLREQVQNVE